MIILPAAVERYLFTLVNRAEGPKCMFVVVARPFKSFLYLVTTEIPANQPNEKLFRLLLPGARIFLPPCKILMRAPMYTGYTQYLLRVQE